MIQNANAAASHQHSTGDANSGDPIADGIWMVSTDAREWFHRISAQEAGCKKLRRPLFPEAAQVAEGGSAATRSNKALYGMRSPCGVAGSP